MGFKFVPCPHCTYIKEHGLEAWKAKQEADTQKAIAMYPEQTQLNDLLNSLEIIDLPSDSNHGMVIELYNQEDPEKKRVREWITAYNKEWLSNKKLKIDVSRNGDIVSGFKVTGRLVEKMSLFIGELKIKESKSNKLDIDIPLMSIPHQAVHLEIDFLAPSRYSVPEVSVEVLYNCLCQGPRIALLRRHILTDYGTFHCGIFAPKNKGGGSQPPDQILIGSDPS